MFCASFSRPRRAVLWGNKSCLIFQNRAFFLHMKKDEAEIEELVIASQRGESESFGKLYDIFVDSIYRYIYFRVGTEEAEDLTELVFLKTWENIRSYKKSTHSFSSWIFRIAHNLVVDYYRAHRHNGELTEDMQDFRDEADTPLRTHQHFDQVALAAGMKELKDAYRQIIVLKYINDLSYEEIGFIMGRSQAALRILQFRALKNLRRILEHMGVSEEDV